MSIRHEIAKEVTEEMRARISSLEKELVAERNLRQWWAGEYAALIKAYERMDKELAAARKKERA